MFNVEHVRSYLMKRSTVMDCGCWVWNGCKMPKGYGVTGLRIRGLSRLAHVVSYRVFRGQIPPRYFVLHNCPAGDNPACINPNHLWIGTKGQNNTDRARKGRNAVQFGESGPHHKLTELEVVEIKRLLALPKPPTLQWIADAFNTCKQNISLIRSGKTWKHVGA